MVMQQWNTEVFSNESVDGVARLFTSFPDRPENYREGDFAPFYRSEQELARIRGVAKVVYASNPTGICALDNIVNYTVGNGYKYVVARNAEANPSDILVQECNRVLKEFIERVELWGHETDCVESLHRDGEGIISVVNVLDGYADVEPYMASMLCEPINRDEANDRAELPPTDGEPIEWKYGIATLPGRSHKPLAYHFDVLGDQSDTVVVDAQDVVHCKVNSPRRSKRGITDYYACFEYLQQRAKILGNTAEGVALQAAIAWYEEQAAGVTKTQAETAAGERLVTKQVSDTQNALYNAGVAPTNRARHLRKGSIVTTNAGKTVKPGPLAMSTGVGDTATIVADAVGRFLASRWQMPEFMANNNADVANYASIFVSESPFVLATRRRQRRHGQAMEKLLWRVLEIAIQGGRIRGVSTIDDLKLAVMISWEPPNIESRNRGEDTTRNQTLFNAGILSPETWASREDLDYEAEVDRGAMHNQERFPRPDPIQVVPDSGRNPTTQRDKKVPSKKRQDPRRRRGSDRNQESYP